MKGKLMKGFVGGRGSAGWKDRANVLICILGNVWALIPWAAQFSEQEDEKLIKGASWEKKDGRSTNILFPDNSCEGDCDFMSRTSTDQTETWLVVLTRFSTSVTIHFISSLCFLVCTTWVKNHIFSLFPKGRQDVGRFPDLVAVFS